MNLLRFLIPPTGLVTFRHIFWEEYHECFITGFGKEGMRQLGNAVPVQLAYIVGKSVVGALKES